MGVPAGVYWRLGCVLMSLVWGGGIWYHFIVVFHCRTCYMYHLFVTRQGVRGEYPLRQGEGGRDGRREDWVPLYY
jgi:hypothetical protein